MRNKVLLAVLVAALSVAAAAPSFAWKFASTSDSQGSNNGVNTTVLSQIVNRINAEGVDLLIMQGDLVWGSSNDATLASQYDTWKSVTANLNCPYYVVPGNHDVSTSTSENVWRSKFSMPGNGPSGYEETVWSFDHQDAHFVGLNSEHYGQAHLIQKAWLASDLNATNQPHIFTMCHEPAYPKGPYPGQCLDYYPSERDDFWNILKKYGSKLFFCGHEHVYCWSLNNGIYQQHNGPSGGDERPGYPGTIGVTNYVVVTVNGSNVHGDGKDINGNIIHTWDYSITPQSPYSGVIQLPGTIQAENFDNGGQGVAYYDLSSGNAGGAYRSTDVDIEGCSEGGYNVGWIDSGERLEYTVNVASSGSYNINVRVASPNTGGSFHIEMNGANITGTKTVPNTGGWQTWTTVTAGVTLNAGQQVLRLVVENGGWNVNYMQVSSVGGTNHAAYVSDTIPSAMVAGQTYNCTITMQNDGTTTWTNGSGPADYNFGPWDAPPGPNINWASRVDVGANIAPGQQKTFNLSVTPPGGTAPGQYNTTWGMVQETVQWFQNMVTKPITISSAGQTPYAGVISLPGTIQAENFDNGGEGVAYHDTSGGNAGGQYRSTDVDIETTSDTGGGYNVGWIDSGEWLEWTVNVASSGDYDFYVRVASPNANNAFLIKIDNIDITGTRVFDSTGGWQTYTTIIVPARYMSAGQHILQFYVVTGGFNINKIDVYGRGADAVSFDAGNPEFPDGITHVQVSDGDSIPWVSAGHRCRENVWYDDVYMYFSVSSAWAWQGNKPNVYITFDYYDLGTGQLGLDYDSTSNPYKHVNGPTLTNTGTFKQYTFHVTDAYFGNRQNGNTDFRITAGAYEWGIDTITVYQ